MAKIIIFGATSAIAAECAVLYAARGEALCLVGRNREKLDAVAARAAAVGSTDRVRVIAADLDRVQDHDALIARVLEVSGGADAVLIAHGLLGDQLLSERDFAEAQRIILTNFTSAVSLIIPLANYFEQRRAGVLGVITSVAGERGRPRNYTYGACKGALGIYLQGVRSRLYSAGVSITTIKLGPVDSPMTASHEKNPLFAHPQGVARDIVAAMDARKAEVFVPRRWAAIMPIVRNTPESLFQRVKALSGR
jgi:decaprenylphospho-beta-D-erythro-pentofuranosid-2-ulose 2-reductase